MKPPTRRNGCTAAAKCLTEAQLSGAAALVRRSARPADEPRRARTSSSRRRKSNRASNRARRNARRDRRTRTTARSTATPRGAGGLGDLRRRPVRRRNRRLRHRRTPQRTRGRRRDPGRAQPRARRDGHRPGARTPGTAAKRARSATCAGRSNRPSEFGTPLGVAEDGAPYNQLINGAPLLLPAGVEQRNRRLRAAPRASCAAGRLRSHRVRVPAIGGNTILINGSSFTRRAAKSVSERSRRRKSRFSARRRSKRVVPPGTSGRAAVTVVTEAGASAPSSSATYKYGSPTVTALAPRERPAVGGGRQSRCRAAASRSAARRPCASAKLAATGVSCATTVDAAPSTRPAAVGRRHRRRARHGRRKVQRPRARPRTATRTTSPPRLSSARAQRADRRAAPTTDSRRNRLDRHARRSSCAG